MKRPHTLGEGRALHFTGVFERSAMMKCGAGPETLTGHSQSDICPGGRVMASFAPPSSRILSHFWRADLTAAGTCVTK